ncbi:hypothetical protein OS242_01385 [Tumebacillus sp. DT12]|uniref:YtzI protein n=1 Tax=Tumebacillus lacus TaxID=2995335 RepID=A0ABT3WVJ9_9BACL|nr:hypothetical protein [Tumebacillus lacus]MCX7568621.1 hypothetical protein [Tumebacillus lacus]
MWFMILLGAACVGAMFLLSRLSISDRQQHDYHAEDDVHRQNHNNTLL